MEKHRKVTYYFRPTLKFQVIAEAETVDKDDRMDAWGPAPGDRAMDGLM